MKRKEDNLKRITCVFTLVLGLSVSVLHAQNRMDQRVPIHVKHVMIELGFIENIKLQNNQGQYVEVISENSFGGRPNFNITEKNGTLWIKANSPVENRPENIDKDCVVQPVYPSYIIRIPKGKHIDLSIDEGNFYAKDFYGDVNLNLERGLATIEQFHGKMQVNINVGNVYCTLSDTEFDLQTNLGDIRAKSKSTTGLKSLKGITGKRINRLKIKALKANIFLNETN